MAPIRRYLRISPDWVLEVRVYLDNPALAQTWLLNPRDPVLPRVIQAVKPLIKPKLWEERERSQGKGKKKKGVKDVVKEDDFEVSIFLTDLSTPHSLLTKQKQFTNTENRIRSNSGKLTSWLTSTTEKPINVDDDEAPVVLREESDEEGPGLLDYPEAEGETVQDNPQRKRRRDDYAETISVSEVSEDEGFQDDRPSDSKRSRNHHADAMRDNDGDDKKKLKLNTSYDGFKIFGRILCLVVKRSGNRQNHASMSAGDSRQMLESWVSTQAAQEPQPVDDD